MSVRDWDRHIDVEVGRDCAGRGIVAVLNRLPDSSDQVHAFVDERAIGCRSPPCRFTLIGLPERVRIAAWVRPADGVLASKVRAPIARRQRGATAGRLASVAPCSLGDAYADVVPDVAEVRVRIFALVGVHPRELALPLDLPFGRGAFVRGDQVACEPLVDDAGLLLGPE
jgi:hypothetical protein